MGYRGLRTVVWLGGALLALAGCTRGSGGDDAPVPAFRNVADEAAFVGDAACASCHEEAYAGYQAHGMAQSFYRLTDENRAAQPLGTPLVHAATGLAYTVEAADDGWYQVEFIEDAQGQRLHELRRRMTYAMGSGHAARTYFAERNGRLFELPLTWYTQAQRWDFSPGYEVANARFGRLMPDRCMACHNSYPEARPFAEGTYTAVPEGIGCERCHGPGALHVEARLADPEPAGPIDDTIVNPAHLPLDRRLDVCQQCHLQTTVSVLREGRGAFDFRPSEALRDHLAFFVAHRPASTGGIDVVSHADRMQRSACFLETQGTAQPLECTTCHDPHAGFRDAGPAYFNDTCLGCHAPATLPAPPDHSASANCIACHMPKVEAEDAPHASFTDHWIRVLSRTPAPAPHADAPLLEAYDARDAGSREGQAYLGMALVVQGRQANDPNLLATGAATLEVALQADTTRGEAHFLLGVAQQQLGHLDRAIPALERAVRVDPGIPQRLHALARAYEATGRDPAVIERLYRRALEVQPALARLRVDYGRFLQAQGRPAEAEAAFRAARTEEPWLDVAALSLGLLGLEQGRPEEARPMLADALHLNPQWAETLANVLVVRNGQVTAATPLPHALVTQAQDRVTIRLVPAGAGVRIVGVPPRATLRLYTDDGLLLRTLDAATDAPDVAWDLTAAGRLLPTGRYLLHVRSRDAAGQSVAAQVVAFALVHAVGGSGR